MDFSSWKYKKLAYAIGLSIFVSIFVCFVTRERFPHSLNSSGIIYDFGTLLGCVLFQWVSGVIIATVYWLFKRRTTKFLMAWIKCTLGISLVFFVLAYQMMEDPHSSHDQADTSSVQNIPCQGADALNACRLKAEQGAVSAQFNLGLLYERGDGVSQDYIEAKKWYQMAADQGNAEAQESLGLLYAQGQGVTQDYLEAKKWFQKAADQGNAKAKNSLGILYAQGLGVQKDETMAKTLVQKAANQGDTTVADVALSALNDPTNPNHDEVTALAAKEIQKFETLANQGDAEAQSALGDMYVEGKVVPQDYVKAVAWWRRAADQGLARAQYNLGVSYAKGSGLQQNPTEAKKWFQRAADQGNTEAQAALSKY